MFPDDQPQSGAHEITVTFQQVGPEFRYQAQCECGWTSGWYPRSGMAAAATASHIPWLEPADPDQPSAT